MNRRTALVAVILILALVLPLVICAKRATHARLQAEAAQALLVRTKVEIQEVLELRQQQQVVNVAERPAQDVIAMVNSALADLGIPTNRLKSLSPESDTAITPRGSVNVSGGGGHGATSYRRQSLRLTLENLTVSELGAFLLHWRTMQRVWTPVRIELTHVRGVDENRYDTTILLSAVYIADRPSSSSTSLRVSL